MIHHEDRELEEKLRSFPTTEPPAELREQILRAARARSLRRTWARPLAYALCLIGLLALDIGTERMQSARLSRLMGDGRQGVVVGDSGASMLMAFQHREALLLAMLERGEMP